VHAGVYGRTPGFMGARRGLWAHAGVYGRTPGFMGARRAPLQVTMGVNENGRELEG